MRGGDAVAIGIDVIFRSSFDCAEPADLCDAHAHANARPDANADTDPVRCYPNTDADAELLAAIRAATRRLNRFSLSRSISLPRRAGRVGVAACS